MKTKIYLVSVMALSLGINLSAQTNKVTAEQPGTEQANASAENKRILSRLGGKAVPDNMSAEHPLAVKTANISGESERNELLKLAEALAYQAKRLKNDAGKKSGAEKEQMLTEAAQFERNCLQKQIEASEIFGTISQVKFNSNKETIQKLLVTVKLEESKMNQTNQLITSAEKNMQLAKELREESYALTGLTARLGNMSNAEEKEVMALGEQSKAIDILWKRPKGSM